MSDLLILPNFPGMDIAYKRSPLYTTNVQNTPSGREVAVSYESYPRYEWQLKFNVLRNYLTVAEAKQLESLFHLLKGRGDYFLFSDPDRNSVTDVTIGAGTGSNTQYRAAFLHTEPASGLTFLEPVQNVYNETLYVTDWQGKVALSKTARTNLLTRSQEVDNAAWAKVNVTVTANATNAPDGTATADKVIATVTNADHYVDGGTQTLPDNTLYSAMVFVKKADYDTVGINLYAKNGSGPSCVFNFTSKTFTSTAQGTGQSGVTFTATELANGWFKLVVNGCNTLTGGTQARLRVSVRNDAGAAAYAGDGVKGTFIWGGQLEQAAQCGAYIPTVASAVANTDYTLASSGLFTITPAPVAGATISWTGNFRYRCRLLDDKMAFDRIVTDLWKADFRFRSVKV